MIESVLGMFFHDRSLGVQRKNLKRSVRGQHITNIRNIYIYLENAGKRIHQHGEKQQGPSEKETGCVGRQVVKDTTNDQSKSNIPQHSVQEISQVSSKPLKSTTGAELDLHGHGDGKGGFDSPTKGISECHHVIRRCSRLTSALLVERPWIA